MFLLEMWRDEWTSLRKDEASPRWEVLPWWERVEICFLRRSMQIAKSCSLDFMMIRWLNYSYQQFELKINNKISTITLRSFLGSFLSIHLCGNRPSTTLQPAFFCTNCCSSILCIARNWVHSAPRTACIWCCCSSISKTVEIVLAQDIPCRLPLLFSFYGCEGCTLLVLWSCWIGLCWPIRRDLSRI